MMEDHEIARIAMVRAWVDGWVISRDTAPPVPEPWGLRVDVGLPGHRVRHIVPAPTPALIQRLTAEISAPDTWLKLCAPAELVAPWLPSAWSIAQPEFMMTATLAAGPAPHPPGYTPAVTTRSGVTVARLITAAGEIAARGQLTIAGRVATMDQVETAPAHRRRGLGSVIMRMLAAEAATRGATTGVLVATPEGRALYENLGWHLHSPMTAAVLR